MTESHDPLDPLWLDRRRRRAAEEEAEALRAEVVRWVQSGEAGREASEALRDLFREGLEGAVREALADGEVARRLAADLREELAGTFEDEIRHEVGRQVRQALAEELFSQEELAELRQEVRRAATAAVAGPVELEGGRGTTDRRPAGSHRTRAGRGGGATPSPSSTAAARPPTRAAYGSRPAFSGVDWTHPGVLAGLAGALVLGVALIWFLFIRPDPTAAPPAGDDATTPATARADNATTDPDGAASPAPADPADNPLFTVWTRRVAGDYPVPAALPAQPAQRFACWFSGVVPEDLAEAAREAEAAAGGGALENRLRTLFPDCARQDAVTAAPNTAVFAAQAAAHAALERRAAADWAGCRAIPQAPSLDGFQADGVRGPGTYALLNSLAACRGVGAALSFGNSSDVTDYLFGLYLALADLEGEE